MHRSAAATILIAFCAGLWSAQQSQALQLMTTRFEGREIILDTNELMNSNLTYLNNGTVQFKIYTPCQVVRPGTDQGDKMCAVIKHYNWLNTGDNVIRTFAPKRLLEDVPQEMWLRQCIVMFEDALVDAASERPTKVEIECTDRPRCTPIEDLSPEEVERLMSGNAQRRQQQEGQQQRNLTETEQKAEMLREAGYEPTHKCTVVTQIQDGFVNLVPIEGSENFRLEMVEVPVFEPRQRNIQNPKQWEY